MSIVAGVNTSVGAASETTLVTLTGLFTFGGSRNEIVLPSGATAKVRGGDKVSPVITTDESVNLVPGAAVRTIVSPRAGVVVLNVAAKSLFGTTCTGMSMDFPAPSTVKELAPKE